MANGEWRMVNIQNTLSTAYLPPISYIRECIREDEVILEVHETYRKQTIRNHCFIAGPNGKQQLTIPVIRVDGNHTKTKDIRISDTMPWQRNHWQSIETAYNKSPFFLYYRDYFEPFYLKKFDFLVDFNMGLLEVVFNVLRIEKRIIPTDHFNLPVDEFSPELLTPYTQVFLYHYGFLSDLSIIDLLFNLGPDSLDYLSNG
jgi:hypothetical protein